MKTPEYEFYRDRHNRPLVSWQNPPGLMAELNADQLRELAKSLLEAADKLDEKERQGGYLTAESRT